MEAVETPLGSFLLLSDDAGVLHGADFADCEPRLLRLLGLRTRGAAPPVTRGTVPPALKRRITAYFAGDIRAIDGITAALSGTDFQNSVWSALRALPPGAPSTYGRLAQALGRPTAVRAVGHANGANPFCIVVPCHRLIGADGRLVGYSGGLARKRWLLDHERQAG